VSLADLNYWRWAGSSVRLMIALHVQVIQIQSSSAPPSSSPQYRCSSRKATRLARRWLSPTGGIRLRSPRQRVHLDTAVMSRGAPGQRWGPSLPSGQVARHLCQGCQMIDT